MKDWVESSGGGEIAISLCWEFTIKFSLILFYIEVEYSN